MPTKNPEIQTTSQHPTTRQRCNHQTSARLTESCHLRSKCVLPKFGTQRADTQPNIDGRGGVNPNLAASTVSTGVKPDVRATGIVVGKAVKVSQQALSQRFLSFPAELFEHVFLLPQLQARWHQRQKRPLPVAVKYAHKHFDIWIVDGSTLEALFRKLESLQDAPQGKLAGKLCTVIDLTRLPVQVWFSHQSCTRYEFPGRFAQFHPASTLLILDRGFYDFGFCALNCQTSRFHYSDQIQCSVWSWANFEFRLHAWDRLICFKTGDKTNHCYGCASSKSAKVKQCMVTSPQCSTSSSTVCRCWPLRTRRIEEAFNTAKRLLGLSYLWTG